jgi:hypothetical protein
VVPAVGLAGLEHEDVDADLRERRAGFFQTANRAELVVASPARVLDVDDEPTATFFEHHEPLADC